MLEEIERLIKEYAISQGLDEDRAEIYTTVAIYGELGGIVHQVALLANVPALISKDTIKTHKEYKANATTHSD